MQRSWITRRRGLPALLGAGAGLGVAAATYGAFEAQNFVIRDVVIPCLPQDHQPIRVLHLSDLHVTPRQTAKLDWIATLRETNPDLVIDTGDNLAHRNAIPPLLEALGPLLDVPGVFVFGSNDYYSPRPRNPFEYLLPDHGKRNTDTPMLPWRDLRFGFKARGWLDLTNARASLTVRDTTIAFAGVDDPHLELDRLDLIAGPADAEADLRVGVAHAPYLRVLDQFAADGYDVTFAGHTHGGQVCLPIKGALVTNCDIDTKRAKGLHRHPADSRPGQEGSNWLHVSAGAGTSPFAPIRICCRPEATIATLVPGLTAVGGLRRGSLSEGRPRSSALAGLG